jgi:DNA repair exonuclease SbcCD ATPase subunit
MQMKQLLLPLFVLFTTSCFAQIDSIKREMNLRDKVLNDIQNNFDSRNKTLDSTVTKLDQRLSSLDKSIAQSRDANDKADKLQQRVQAVEEKQKAIEQNELNLFQANYQSAMVNLVSMDREIKPLLLFNSTKSFFNALSETGNPMNYDGYTKWYNQYAAYVKEKKAESPVLNVTSNLLSFAGNFTKGAPVTGPITSALFSSMTTYIDNIGKKEKALKEQSEQMLTLTMKISQFNYDNDRIENEWESITAELQDLQTKYDKSLKENLSIIKTSPADFQANFSKENDAEKRYQYLTQLRDEAAKFVSEERTKNPKDWRQKAYVQMNDVQSLKQRFGQVTFRISQNLLKYKELFDKYKADPQLGARVKDLEIKMKELQESFDKTFDPLEYINSANRMYKV